MIKKGIMASIFNYIKTDRHSADPILEYFNHIDGIAREVYSYAATEDFNTRTNFEALQSLANPILERLHRNSLLQPLFPRHGSRLTKLRCVHDAAVQMLQLDRYDGSRVFDLKFYDELTQLFEEKALKVCWPRIRRELERFGAQSLVEENATAAKIAEWLTRNDPAISQVRFLNLSGEFLHTIPHILNRFENLEELTFLKAKICVIAPRAFDGFPNLRLLDLGENDITSLPPGIFSKNSKLEKLYLNDNHLSDLPPLENLENLVQLAIYNNRFPRTDEIEQALTKALPNLEDLTV